MNGSFVSKDVAVKVAVVDRKVPNNGSAPDKYCLFLVNNEGKLNVNQYYIYLFLRSFLKISPTPLRKFIITLAPLVRVRALTVITE